MPFTTAHSGIGPPIYSSCHNWCPISTGTQNEFSGVMKDCLYEYSMNPGPQTLFGTFKYVSHSMQYWGLHLKLHVAVTNPYQRKSPQLCFVC